MILNHTSFERSCIDDWGTNLLWNKLSTKGLKSIVFKHIWKSLNWSSVFRNTEWVRQRRSTSTGHLTGRRDSRQGKIWSSTYTTAKYDIQYPWQQNMTFYNSALLFIIWVKTFTCQPKSHIWSWLQQDHENCDTCGEERAEKKCSECKSADYCDQVFWLCISVFHLYRNSNLDKH